MPKLNPIPAAEFTRNFGRYRMLAQKSVVPVTSHGQITGYFVAADEFEEFERYRAQRQSFATRDLPSDTMAVLATTTMDPRHRHLDDLMDDQ